MWPTLRFTFRTPAGFWFSLLLFSKVIVPSFRDAKSNDGHAKMRVAIPVYYGVVYCVYVNSVLDFLWDISLWKPGYLKVLFFLFSFFLFFFFLLESSVRSWRYIYIYTRIVLLLFSLFLFLVCEQLLAGLVYPLAVKARNLLDLIFIQKSALLLSGAARSTSFPFLDALSVSLFIKNVKIKFKRFWERER